MGELTFIKDGYATTIHDNGDMTIVAAQQCDDCLQWKTGHGGFTVRDVSNEPILWLCADCRA